MSRQPPPGPSPAATRPSGKIAYISPHGGEYVAVVDLPDPRMEHRVMLGELVRVDLPAGHPANDLGSLHGAAHEEKTVRRFGGP